MKKNKSLEQLKKEALTELKNEKPAKTETKKSVAKNPVTPKVTAKTPKVASRPSNLKSTMSLEERVVDTTKKLNAFEMLVDAFPFNSCFIKTRDRMRVKLQKLQTKVSKKEK